MLRPREGGSWARQLDGKYPIGGDWGRAQRPPEEDERNYYIFGMPPKKKQIEAREKLVAEGKPLGPHAAKEVRSMSVEDLFRKPIKAEQDKIFPCQIISLGWTQ